MPVINQLVSISVGKYIAPKQSIYDTRRRQGKNILIALHPIQRSQRRDTTLQCFVTRKSVDNKADRRTDDGWQPTPPVTVVNTQMPFVAAEQLVRSLADQSHLDILARALRDEIHRDDGGSRDWLFQTFHDLWKRSFEFGLVKLHRHMASSQKSGCLLGIRQLVIFESLAVTDSVCWPRAALFIHQRQEKARIKPPAEKNSDRHDAEE